MKKLLLTGCIAFFLNSTRVLAQKVKSADVPQAVKTALSKKYPAAAHVIWEKEKGNFEANWGGRSGEDSSVIFTPDGTFVEIVTAIKVSEIPLAVMHQIRTSHPGAKITEAGKVTDAQGKISWQAEVGGKDIRVSL